MPNFINTALDYTAEGFGVLPLKGNKHPNLDQGHNFLYEIMSDSEIEQRFYNTEKIGIACGFVSSGFSCCMRIEHTF